MPSCWRIVQERFADQAFTGEGARLYGGRWNSPGRSVIYAASTRALASLEMLVHLEAPSLLIHYLLFEAVFPDLLLTELPPAELPPDWQADPAPRSTQSLGDLWIRNATSAALCVPSVLIPEEKNYLLNPNHPDFKQIQLLPPQRFHFDPRLKS